MKKHGLSVLLTLGVIFPLILVFKSIFFGNLPSWGDAPHFFNEGLKELTSFPQAWTQRLTDFGGVNSLLWISPLMFLGGFLYRFFGFNSDLIIRSLFYFPAIILSITSSYFFAKYLGLSRIAKFFTVLVYVFNTYFILLIDGGQVGVALAYGLFPLTLLSLKKLIDSWSIKNFFVALIVLNLNAIADPRITLIAIIAGAVWNFRNIKGVLNLVPLGVSSIFVNAFWIYPFLTNGMKFAEKGMLDVNLVKFYNPILLLSPHWPDNLFGVVTRPPLYFIGVPILVLFGIFYAKKKTEWGLILAYLLFCFLCIFPIGKIFRDSTKFFIPVVLFSGILIGRLVETFKKPIFSFLIFLYLIFLVHPSILGQMNFVLSSRQDENDFIKVYENLKNQSGFFRTAWIPEKHPLAFRTEDRPALDAKELINYFPIARLNVGEDPFNFLNNTEFIDAFRVLGIKYLIASGNPREINKISEQEKNWNEIVSLIDKTQGLQKVDWGLGIPTYEILNPYPHIFSVEKLVAVVGPGLSPKYPSVYFEDGKLNPRVLKNVDNNSVAILFNGKDEMDLTMSLLQKYFTFSKDASSSSWASYSSQEYLKYKYQLLIRGFDFDDFDYGGGISFSTKTGEEILFDLNVPQDGNYLIAVRSIKPSLGEMDFSWKIETKSLSKGVYTHIEKNSAELEIFNAVTLVPINEFEAAKFLTGEYLNNFDTIEEKNLSDFTKYEEFDSNNTKANSWVIQTDNYNPKWILKSGDNHLESLPVYSMVNGFFVGGDSNNKSLEFVGQRNLSIGVKISLTSFFVLMILYFIHEKFKK